MGFGYDNSVSLQTDDAGYVGAAVLAHVACVVVTERGFRFFYRSDSVKIIQIVKNIVRDF